MIINKLSSRQRIDPNHLPANALNMETGCGCGCSEKGSQGNKKDYSMLSASILLLLLLAFLGFLFFRK